MTLTIQGLSIEYPGKRVFDGVDLTVDAGEMIAVVTRVLDGGTSLLRGIGGFLSGVGGRVMLDGVDLLGCDEALRARFTGYVYEGHGLVSLYTVAENIALPLHFHTGLSDREIERRLHAVCDELGMETDLLALRPHQLNDVQARFVNLARALIIEPKLLLIDELEGGMPEEIIKDTMATLRCRQQQHAMAIIITTADDYVVAHADRAYRIADGHLVAVHSATG